MNEENKNNTIISWDEFKDWVSHIVVDPQKYLFRGQMDNKWPLKTSLHRALIELNINMQEYLNSVIGHAHYVISHFQNEIIDLTDPKEFAAFLALLQHHGFPTPLLDWTISPYIGAYFAFRDINIKSPQTDYVKIYMFDYIEWRNHNNKVSTLREKEPFINDLAPYAKNNPRLIAQMCAYTMTNVDDMEKYIQQRSEQIGKTFLYTVLIPVIDRTKAMRELYLMGISEMTLFPGLDGICKTLKEELF